LLGLLAIAGAIYFYVSRTRNTARMTGELLDVANDVRLAARRFGFSRRSNLHPAEAIEDPMIAIAGISVAYQDLDGLPTQEERRALTSALARVGNLNLGDAEELVVLGNWLVTECGGPAGAVSRLSRKLQRMSGNNGFSQVMAVIQAAARRAGRSQTRLPDQLDGRDLTDHRRQRRNWRRHRAGRGRAWPYPFAQTLRRTWPWLCSGGEASPLTATFPDRPGGR